MRPSPIAVAKTADICIDVVPISDFYGKAISQYNYYKMKHNDYNIVAQGTSRMHKDFVILNYIRHNFTNYDKIVRKLDNYQIRRSNKKYALDVLRDRVNMEIVKQYNLQLPLNQSVMNWER